METRRLFYPRMRSLRLLLTGLLLLCSAPPSTSADQPWVLGFYPGWKQDRMPPTEIDYRPLTHVVHFSGLPQTDGSIDYSQHGLSLVNSQAAVAAAHANGKKILLCIGSAETAPGFRGAASNANRAKFIQNIVSTMQSRGYDGVDIDWEPLASSDSDLYFALLRDLRAALDAVGPNITLTIDVTYSPAVVARVQSYVDQINVMTYAMAGPWPGWATWHHSALFDGGNRFPSSGKLVPSGAGKIAEFEAAGIPRSKLGFGLAYFGQIWTGGSGTPTGGVTAPMQSYSADPSVSEIDYQEIMRTWYSASRYHWDNAAGVAYLSIDEADSSQDRFISYDTAQSIVNKVAYAKALRLGGFIIWEITAEYRSDLPRSERHPLSQALFTALSGGTSDSVPAPPGNLRVISRP
ncbi:MAG: glycoside hydrolase family 18 protein [Candidatus Binatia bacterium]